MVWNDHFNRARAHVIGAHVAWRGRQPFADAAADDHQVPVDRAGRRQPDALRGGIAPEVLAEIDAATGAEALDRLCRSRDRARR